jgi:hypothetical protein
MSIRFVSNAVLALAAGFVVVASQAFSSSTTGWIAFGVAIGILAVASLAQADRSRGLLQRAFDGVTAVVGAWTIVASVVFSGTALTWLSAAEGIALVALAYAGLTANELRRQPAVHTLAETTMGESLREAA